MHQSIWSRNFVLSLCSSVGMLTIAYPVNAGGYDIPPGGSPSASPNEAFNSSSPVADVPDENSSRSANSSNNSSPRAFQASSSIQGQPSATSIEAWRNWSQPYSLGNSLCRESGGNLVCLSSDSASYMRW